MRLDILSIVEQYHQQGLGLKLFQKIEEFAKNGYVVAMKIRVLDFQAKEFNQKMSFSVICILRDCPRGNVKYE